VEDDVVDLVVAVDKGRAVLGLRLWVFEEGYHVVLVWYLAYWLPSLLVFGRTLRFRDGIEGCNLAVVEARVLAVGGEVDRSGGYAMEFRERGYGGVPPGGYALVPSSVFK